MSPPAHAGGYGLGW